MRIPTSAVASLALPAMLLCAVPGRAQRAPTRDDIVFTVGEATENLIDDYLAGNWVEADAQLDSILGKQSDVLDAMSDAGAPPATLDLFSYLLYRLGDLTWNRDDPLQAALTANQLTAQLIELDRGVVTDSKLATARMDYLGREVLLLSQVDDDRGLLSRRIDELTSTWSSVAPTIVEAGEAELVDRMDGRLDRLRGHSPKATLAQVASDILDLVDELEAVVR